METGYQNVTGSKFKTWIFNLSLKKVMAKIHAPNEGFDRQSYHSTEFLNVMLHETVKCLPPENKPADSSSWSVYLF